LALSGLDPGGDTILSNPLLIEPRHLRSDNTRPGDLSVMAGGRYAKGEVIDLMISSSLLNSIVLQSSKSFDFALRKAENTKNTSAMRNTLS
jgi:hypothetical protein